MNLTRLIRGIDVLETNLESFDIEISSVSADSRTLGPGEIFVSLAGESFNGHRYIGEALSRRAAVIVIDEKSFIGGFPYIRVTSARRAYAQMWSNFCHSPSDSLECIAVTGTNGKSSTVEMLTHILNYSGKKACAIGTLHSSMTTPDPPQLYPRLKELCKNGCRYGVIEASSHGLYLEKLAPIDFKLAVFTNLSRDHLDYHGNMRSYAGAKAKLFSQCSRALYNLDDKYGKEISSAARRRCSYSFTNLHADFVCRNMRVGLEEGCFDFLTVGELFRVRGPISGSFGIYNAMAACSAAYMLGVDKASIKSAMAQLPTIAGRMERVEVKSRDYRVFVDYAHTPDAMAKLLSGLRSSISDNERLVCVFGCGGSRDKGKRPIMGELATALADMTVITSDNPRDEDPFDIIRDILRGADLSKPHIVIPHRGGAIRYAIHSAQKGDVIVFCGKGHENYQIDKYGKTPFDEKELIREADKERIEKKGNEHYTC